METKEERVTCDMSKLDSAGQTQVVSEKKQI